MNDRNKTELTQNITRIAALWLDGHGFKPVETEVPIEEKWVADVAGICELTPTELIEMKILPRRPSLRWEQRDNEPAVTKYKKLWEIWQEQFQKIPPRMAALIEVKTSVSDFRNDDKWIRQWPVNLCYLAMPEGMIEKEKWPKGWGVILFDKAGTMVRKAYPSDVELITHERLSGIAFSVAIRRDHRTRRETMREFQKEIRIEAGERKTVERVSNAVSFVLKCCEGGTLEDAKRWSGIRTTLPFHLVNRVNELRIKVGLSPFIINKEKTETPF